MQQDISNKYGYRLGCPMWGNKSWTGDFFTADAQPSDFLNQYGSVFNAVEGNTTFYGMPSDETVQQWREQTVDNFQFNFKFPQRISHGLKLKDARTETYNFFKTLHTLENKLGPFLLQLPAQFSPQSLDVLARYLRSLPREFRYLVEVRHLEFFHDAAADQALCDLLQTQNIDRVMFDTRPLFSDRASLDAVKDAQKKKPRVPANTYALSHNPTLRFIGHSQMQRSLEYFRPWWRKVANWIVEGREPQVFIHTPDNKLAPQLAYQFHKGLQELLPAMPDLAVFPGLLPRVQTELSIDSEPRDDDNYSTPEKESEQGQKAEVQDLSDKPVDLSSEAPLLSQKAVPKASEQKIGTEDQMKLF